MNPYDESLVYGTNAKVRALYADANRQPDAQYPVWIARTVYDYCAGMSWAASEAKHLDELRAALGIPIPVPPVEDTWPRLGLSYYTSATDPRLDIPGFAARLRDAGADYTRVWLIDAWAVSASGGTGCYDGWLPWRRASDGRFDLWDINPTYFDRLRFYVEQLNAVGVLPQLCGWELYTWSDRKAGMLWVPDARQGPFRKNRQGVYYADDSAFDRIGQPSGEDAFLGHFYRRVVQTLGGTTYAIELANEMPQKELHIRLRDAWRAAGYVGSISVNRNEDTPGQYSNMKIGTNYSRIAYHGKRDLGYLDEDFADEPVYRTFRAFYDSTSYESHRIVLSSDGCRKSTDVNDAYDYDALGAVFRDGLARGFSVEHQSRMKLRGFTENRIDLHDLEVDWLQSLGG